MAYLKQDGADKSGKLALCYKDRTLLESEVDLFKQKVAGLQADKEVYKKESDKFQSLYVAADKARVESETNQPSRLRWFAIGVVTALAVALGGVITLK